MLQTFMHTKLPIQDLLSLQLHNLNSEDKSSFNELRDFFMQAPVPLAILKGPEHFFTLSNVDYERLIGRSAMGKNLLEVFSEDELDQSLEILNEVYKTGIPFIGKDTARSTPFKSSFMPVFCLTNNGALTRCKFKSLSRCSSIKDLIF